LGRKEESSFSEEKEAKRLLNVRGGRGVDRNARGQVAKVFCSFFSKKECFLSSLIPPAPNPA
jgi:hypothetical protein